jgi:hypothetical protein
LQGILLRIAADRNRATNGGRHGAGDERRATWGGRRTAGDVGRATNGGEGGGGYRRVSSEWMRAGSIVETMLADLRDERDHIGGLATIDV